jgi:pyridoxamine 5'-phosphate oxidase
MTQHTDDRTRTRLTGRDFEQDTDPFALFAEWLGEAALTEPSDPNAMSLATVDADGWPDVRIVLLKGVDESGFVFFTNLESSKGRQLAGQKRAALAFHWKTLERQVRLRGSVEPVAAEEADAYYATRPRLSQIGAWASRQSRPLSARAELEAEVARYEAEFAGGAVPRPSHWSGFRVVPLRIEFWHNRPFRLHDRIVFSRSGPDAPFTRQRLFP